MTSTKKNWLAFHGAAGGVTGSKSVIHHAGGAHLIDCGLFQGTTLEREQNWQPFHFDQTALRAAIITHAHMDHAGLLPRLVQRGFRGPIYCTEGTAELLPVMLRDSARLQLEEARYRNKRGWSKHHPALPLYSEDDVEFMLQFLKPCQFEKQYTDHGLQFSFHPAQHIIGSAHVLVQLAGGERILFSGDVGRGQHPLFRPVPPRPEAEVVVCESTYGDRSHASVDPEKELQSALEAVLSRRGVALLPAFAVGRAQELMVSLEKAFTAGALSRCPVYLDSPMSAEVLRITEQGQSEITPEGLALLKRAHAHTQVTASPEQSKLLNDVHGPAIIICSSGMITGGRVLHHLINRAGNPQDALILCGFQARGTRGRILAEGNRTVKIFGQPTDIKLEVSSLSSFSAHADREGLLRWLDSAALPRRIVLQHGEPSAAAAFEKTIRAQWGDRLDVWVAVQGEKFELANAPL